MHRSLYAHVLKGASVVCMSPDLVASAAFVGQATWHVGEQTMERLAVVCLVHMLAQHFRAYESVPPCPPVVEHPALLSCSRLPLLGRIFSLLLGTSFLFRVSHRSNADCLNKSTSRSHWMRMHILSLCCPSCSQLRLCTD